MAGPLQFKLILVGNASVGKTAMISRWMGKPFEASTRNTVGVECMHKAVRFGVEEVIFNLWDTAGAERYRSLTRKFLRGAHGVVIAFSVADRASFEAVAEWQDVVMNEAEGSRCQFVLAGNKCDLREGRVISGEEARVTAARLQMDYSECSAKTGEGIDALFDVLTRITYGAHTDPDRAKSSVNLKERHSRGHGC